MNANLYKRFISDLKLKSYAEKNVFFVSNQMVTMLILSGILVSAAYCTQSMPQYSRQTRSGIEPFPLYSPRHSCRRSASGGNQGLETACPPVEEAFASLNSVLILSLLESIMLIVVPNPEPRPSTSSVPRMLDRIRTCT